MTLDEVQTMAETLLRRHGFTEPHVQAVARAVLAGERDECASHGLWRLLGCIDTLRNGKVIADADPKVFDQAPGIVRVDARGGFSQLAFERGIPSLIEKARHAGIAALAINHCVHFSALWSEIEVLTDAGLVALAFTPSHSWVAPAGGHKPLFGTNPIAFGWPRPNQPPFIFDFATSAVARGEIQLHQRAGKSIPLGWGVDTHGQPSTDPSAVLQGAMLTFGGHKGSALSAMVELIAGPLIGDLTSAESMDHAGGVPSSPYHGELLLALDPQRFLGDQADAHLARAELLFDGIQGQGARLPSQRRYEARERSLRDGVRISASLFEELQGLLV